MEQHQKKGRLNFKMDILLLVVLFNLILFSVIVSAPPPIPRNVDGRVLTNSTNGVQNGIPARINSTVTKDSVLVYTDAPDIPQLRGSYSLTIQAENGEDIIGFSWNATHWGTNTTTVQGSTTSLNIALNMSRPSEANVTILLPGNNSLFNKTIAFNVTANISMMGSDGTGCNATIRFSNNATMNITSGESLNHSLGDILFQTHKVTNWSVAGLNEGISNITVSVSCASDGINFEGLSSKTVENITIVNLEPSIESLYLTYPADLIAGGNLTFTCNATIVDNNSVADIKTVNATIFQWPADINGPNDNNNHYTNSSCANFSSSQKEANYSCGFKVAYYANNGTWRCNLSVSDYSNATKNSNSTFLVNELMALEISPSVIDYGAMKVTNISGVDVNITVRNAGNVPINATVRGFAPNESLSYLNLSMNCMIGNISNSNQRYSITNGSSFNSMTQLNNETRLLNFSLPQRTNDIDYGNDTNFTFWKLQVPLFSLGFCNGTVMFGAISLIQ